MRVRRALLLGASWLLWPLVAPQNVPERPFLELSQINGNSALATLGPPVSDGGSPILSYEVDWDTNPGRREVQSITTSVFLGPNEIQSVTTKAMAIEEVQFIASSATPVAEVQSITVSSATAGYFFIELDTSSLGGSLQYSGYIGVSYPAKGSYYAVDSILSAMSNVQPYGRVNVSRVTIDASTYEYLVTFPLAMGDVPQMVVSAAALTPLGVANAFVQTITPGNVIGGSFTLTFAGSTTAAIAYDASPNDLRLALEVSCRCRRRTISVSLV